MDLRTLTRGHGPHLGVACNLGDCTLDLAGFFVVAANRGLAMTARYSHLAPTHTLAAVERLDSPTEAQLPPWVSLKLYACSNSFGGVARHERARVAD
jgi:hypothetical protein